MKNLLTVLTFAILLSSFGCAEGEKSKAEIIKEKKEALKEKKATLKTLNAEIDQLVEEIEILEPPKEKVAKLVTTTSAERKTFQHFVEIQGSVQSDDYVNATSEVAGRIIELSAQEGQFVKKGQVIARLDLEQVNKQIAELQTSLDLAKDVYDRQKRLWDQNIGSEIQYLQAKNNKERIEKSLETINFQLTKGNVYAPISGTVEMVIIKSGEIAAPGAPIIQILNTNQVKVVASVPENYLQAIQKGEMVTVKFPALDQEQKARISLIGNTIDPANRTFNVEVNLSNPSGLLKPNLLATMMINDLTREDVVAIPLELVQQEVSGKDYVYVKKDSDSTIIAEKRYVTTAESFEGEIIIEEGLKGGEHLIVDGARGLTANETIKVIETNNTED